MSGKLPDVESMGQMDDDALLSYITSTIKAVRSEEKGSDDFSSEINWALQIITTKALNKSQALYKAGLIFVGKTIAINTSSLAKLLNLSSIQLNRRIKAWTNAFWDMGEKKNFLIQFDIRVDIRQWVLKKVPPKDPIMLYSDCFPSTDETEDIHFVNKTPAPNVAQPTAISLDFFNQMDFVTRKNVSISPKVWTFDKKPDEVLLFGF